MGKVWHPEVELLSALADSELAEPQAIEVRAHVTLCASCAADVAAFARTDTLLAVQSTDELAWETLKQALGGLPSGRPSARVDHAIAAMVRQPAPARPAFWPPAPAGVAVRVAVAAAAAVALVVGVVGGQGGAPQLAQQSPGAASPATAPQQKEAFVAAIQTSVLHTGTNTLYVLQSAEGAVAAYNAKSYELKAQITVGGRPSALALNPADDVVVVLDASLKTLTEIDPGTNHVIATTAIDVPGTPTSVQYDDGRYAVMSIPDTSAAGPGPLVSPDAPATAAAPSSDLKGQVTLIDTATKRVEVTKAIDVAPRLVVPDPQGQFTLLVSPDATTMVDASYSRISTLPGGISAAFDARRGLDTFAILSENAGATDVQFVGRNAPAALHLDAKPYAMTAMPHGGFAVLVGEGTGGRIVVIGPNGKADQAVEVSAVGPTLDYDTKTDRFTVTSDGAVASAALSGAVAIVQTPAPAASAQPQASASASPLASGSAAPSGSAQPTGSPGASLEPGASASPSASAPPETTAVPLPSQPVNEVVTVPDDVIQVGNGFYRLPLPHAPVLSAASGTRMWFLDDANGLNTLNVENGEIFRIAQLPADARVRTVSAGGAYVYATDPSKARLFVFNIREEELTVHALPAVDVSAAAITGADALVLAMPGSQQLLVYRPLSQHFSTIDIGTYGASALAVDGVGRIWFAAGTTLGYYDGAAHKTVGVAWTGGQITQLLVDRGGIVWAGTSDGQIWSVNGGLVSLALALGSPVSALAIDPAGQTWYLAPGPTGFRYGPVVAGGHERTVPGPAIGLAPNSQGRAWLADPLGGLYLGLER